MIFEYDPIKSKINKEKHGIDFEEAQALWEDTRLFKAHLTDNPESRFFIIGFLSDKHWTAIITYREENVRIISVRRSRRKEIEFYEKDNNI